MASVVDGIGVGKAQEPFGLAAEVDTGGDADMGFFQQVEGQLHGAAAQMAGIDQHVERSHGFHGDVEAQALQLAQQEAAAFVVGGMHAGHVFIGTGQGRDTGFLHRRIGGQKEVLHQGLHGAHEITGHDEIAQAPAGHGIGLGKAAYDHGIVRVL